MKKSINIYALECMLEFGEILHRKLIIEELNVSTYSLVIKSDGKYWKTTYKVGEDIKDYGYPSGYLEMVEVFPYLETVISYRESN